jgi:regulator of protease activity HflC (stomatin/prohibitin superfamily)
MVWMVKKMKKKAQVWLTSFFVLIFIIGIIVFMGFDYVPAGYVGVKDRLGEVNMIPLTPGVYWTGILTTTHEMDARILKAEYVASAASKDLQTVKTQVAINYKINPSQAPNIYKDIGLGYQDVIIQPSVQESIKSQTAKYNAEELITSREEIKSKITDYLINKLSDKGLIVTEVSITDFDFSAEFNKAIEAKQVAQQKALEAENRLRETEFNAKALTLQKDLLEVKKLDIEIRKLDNQLEYINKWDGKLPTYVMGNEALSMLPIGGE